VTPPALRQQCGRRGDPARAALLRGSGLAITPADDLGDAAGSYECVELVSSPAAVHVRLTRTP